MYNDNFGFVPKTFREYLKTQSIGTTVRFDTSKAHNYVGPNWQSGDDYGICFAYPLYMLTEICSSYTDYVMWRQNDCFNVFQSVILSGLMSRIGVCKVFWEQSSEGQEEGDDKE